MIFRSPLPDVPIPDVPLTSFVFENVAEKASKPALIDGPTGRILTYGDLYAGIRRVARGLFDRGFEKGDVFAIYCPNVPEYAIAFHAAAMLGGIVTTINPLYTTSELSRQLSDAGAKYLLTVPPFLDRAREAAQGSRVAEIFVLGDAEGASPFTSLLGSDESPPEVPIRAEDVVALPYSSGTTGLQKGVMLTHRNLVANLQQTTAVFSWVSERDIALGLLPFFHIYGLVVVLNMMLLQRATVVTVPRFDLTSFLGILSKYRITVAHLVPPLILALAKQPAVDQYDLSSLRWIFSGAAPLGRDLVEACSRRLNCVVLQGYGLTETSPVTHTLLAEAAVSKAGSVGPVAPNTECKIVDPATGEVLGPGKNGEIWMRGPQIMKGYLNQPQATAAAIDTDGFFHSGDIGYADEDGYFYIVDRLKELIKYKGLQVAPAELESLLLSHPAVADAAVIPVPDEEAGEVPKAFVVRKGDVTEQALIDFVAERVAPYKKIRRVEIIDQIPKSPSGKILRRLLVERERERARSKNA